MKRLFLPLLLGASALVQSASALTIDNIVETPDTFSFDVIWGSTGFAPADVFVSRPHLSLDAHEHGHTAVVASVHEGDLMSPYFASISIGLIPLPGDFRLFLNAEEVIDSGPNHASSITATPDGFGAHIVFGIPDSGSSAALIGFGMVGCVALRKRFGKST